ncbi:hypothetical protein ACGFJT_44255 [Actinomadura geliboluensis]|uniref:hypothetical protein n=1 Tax=Actinomadura geliboluensis TaxID=882440 RepID=UPI00372040C5
MSAFQARNRWLMMLAAVVLVGGILTWTNHAGHGRSLAEQEAEITKLQGDLQQRRRAEAEVVDENAAKALGVTATRLESDEAIITPLLSTAFTWDSGAAYENARESLRRKYGLAGDDGFLRDFIPPALYTVDGKGKKHYLFDRRGVRATLGGDPEITVVQVTGTKYRYAVIADLVFRPKRQAANGRGERAVSPSVTRRVLLWITLDGEGAVSDLSGIFATGTTRSSR